MSPIHFSFRLNFQFTSTRPPSADTHDNLVKYTAQKFNYPAELLDLDNPLLPEGKITRMAENYLVLINYRKYF